MLISFDQMPDHARVWVYQASRPLSPKEVEFVQEKTSSFLDRWQAHGQDLKASFNLLHQQFLVISVDEGLNQASGCSIDASVHLIQSLEQHLDISFMTSDRVAFMFGDSVNLLPFIQVKKEIEAERIAPSTLVFDNTVKNIGEFKGRWLVESKETWLSRYFA